MARAKKGSSNCRKKIGRPSEASCLTSRNFTGEASQKSRCCRPEGAAEVSTLLGSSRGWQAPKLASLSPLCAFSSVRIHLCAFMGRRQSLMRKDIHRAITHTTNNIQNKYRSNNNMTNQQAESHSASLCNVLRHRNRGEALVTGRVLRHRNRGVVLQKSCYGYGCRCCCRC